MRTFSLSKSVTLVCCAFLFSSCLSHDAVKENTFPELHYYYSINPEIRVHVNSPTFLDSTKKTVVVLFALPNGNSIEMTIGRKKADSLDWHYDIQHIGAQIRFLRTQLPENNVIVTYLESAQKSWPAWRKKYTNNAEIIRLVLESIEKNYPANTEFMISGHSGGGSFINGFTNAYDTIPKNISRIIYLDANYSYDDSLDHGKKFLQWLRSDTTHKLSVIAYDDREIVYKGKKIIESTGGTLRATHRMMDFLKKNDIPISFRQDSTIQFYSAMENRARFIIHTNPDQLILHTVLVEKNGLIHSILMQTDREEKEYVFFGQRAYSKFIID
jgi:hypothetical protein